MLKKTSFLVFSLCFSACISTRKQDVRTGHKPELTHILPPYERLSYELKEASSLYLSESKSSKAPNQVDSLQLAASHFNKLEITELVKILQSPQLQTIHSELILENATAPSSALQLVGKEKSKWLSLLLAGVRGDYKSLVDLVDRGDWKSSPEADRIQFEVQKKLLLTEAQELLKLRSLAVHPLNLEYQNRQIMMSSNDLSTVVDEVISASKAANRNPLYHKAEQQVRELIEVLDLTYQNQKLTLDHLKNAQGDLDYDKLDFLVDSYSTHTQHGFDDIGFSSPPSKAEIEARIKAIQTADFGVILASRQLGVAQLIIDQNIIAYSEEQTTTIGRVLNNQATKKLFSESFGQELVNPSEVDNADYKERLKELDVQCKGCLLQTSGGEVSIREGITLKKTGDGFVIYENKTQKFAFQKPKADQVLTQKIQQFNLKPIPKVVPSPVPLEISTSRPASADIKVELVEPTTSKVEVPSKAIQAEFKTPVSTPKGLRGLSGFIAPMLGIAVVSVAVNKETNLTENSAQEHFIANLDRIAEELEVQWMLKRKQK